VVGTYAASRYSGEAKARTNRGRRRSRIGSHLGFESGRFGPLSYQGSSLDFGCDARHATERSGHDASVRDRAVPIDRSAEPFYASRQVVGAGVVTTPESSVVEPFGQRLAEAQQAAQARQFGRAETLLSDLVQERPESVEALDLLGFVLFFSGRAAEAEAVCRRTLTLDPDHPYALSGLGVCLCAQGKSEQGIAALRRAIELRPDWLDPRWDLCVVLLQAGRLNEATRVLEEAAKCLPADTARWELLRQRIDQAR